MAAASTRSPSPSGLGIDLAEARAFDRLSAGAIERAARRWLGPGERAWCAAQPSFREALVTVLSCKESVFKASGGAAAVHEVTLEMSGDWPRGWARAEREGLEPVVVFWEVSAGRILTLGVEGSVEESRRLVERIIYGRRAGESA